MNTQLVEQIKTYLREHPELRREDYSSDEHPLTGHCYVASEAYHHMSDEPTKPMQLQHEGVSHWFLKNKETGEIIDLTAEQFNTPVPYDEARGRGFQSPNPPSNRTKKVINDIEEKLKKE